MATPVGNRVRDEGAKDSNSDEGHHLSKTSRSQSFTPKSDQHLPRSPPRLPSSDRTVGSSKLSLPSLRLLTRNLDHTSPIQRRNRSTPKHVGADEGTTTAVAEGGGGRSPFFRRRAAETDEANPQSPRGPSPAAHARKQRYRSKQRRWTHRSWSAVVAAVVMASNISFLALTMSRWSSKTTTSLSRANGSYRRRRPRVVYYASSPWRRASSSPSFFAEDPTLRATPGESSAVEGQTRKPSTVGNCVPMRRWQTDVKPTCNSLHEVDMAWERDVGDGPEDEVRQLGQGWFRIAWRFRTRNVPGARESVILKTLRFDRNFSDEFYDLHRRDAMAMERLTSSDFVLDVYGYCGQTAINEIAVESVERVFRNIRDDDSKNMYKLQIAAQVSTGVADIHEVDGPGNNATMVHYDLNPRNVAVLSNGHVKINDFNVAEFVKWNVVKHKRCGFRPRLHEPWWRAPEEVTKKEDGKELPNNLNEKVDVYALCNVLYRIMTGRAPRGKSIPSRIEEIRREVKKGLPPRLPSKYIDTKDGALVAIRRAMERCYQKQPEDRASAREIANYLAEKYEYMADDEI